MTTPGRLITFDNNILIDLRKDKAIPQLMLAKVVN